VKAQYHISYSNDVGYNREKIPSLTNAYSILITEAAVVVVVVITVMITVMTIKT
jgi:hypothetical protein